MNSKHQKSERGQALIIVVLALVGLIGLTALTIDGGFAYLDRRKAQNAADTAAFAAARAKIRGEDWKETALQMASLNGYSDTDASAATSSTKVNVEVYECTETHSPSCSVYGDDALENPEEYIHVLITTTINTFFGPVVGVTQITNHVDAVTHAKPGSPNTDTFGNAMESLMPGCKDGSWNYDPYTITGTGDTVVTGSGVMVNSSCDEALTQNGDSTMNVETEEGICVVGTSDVQNPANVVPPPVDNCSSPSPQRQWPKPSCDLDKDGIKDSNEMGQITEVAGLIWTSTPGYYNGDFPTGASGQLLMQEGIYCIEGDFSVGSTLNVSTDVNQNGAYDYTTEGVLIYVTDGSVTFNGSSDIDIHAISDPSAPLDIQNLLIFLPEDNCSSIKITGNSGSEFTGSIWAPCSLITLEGSAGGTTVNSQIIGYSIKIAGNGNLHINYDEEENAVSVSPPTIELNQ